MRVIGVSGHPSSGKDTVAEYITAKGFFHVSSGDAIRRDMKLLGLTTDRTSINHFVTDKRKEVGASYPIPEIADAVNVDTVISGLRNVTEIKFLKGKFESDFFLIAVEAPIEIRYEWAKARGRVGDDITFERFKQEEEQERSGSDFHQVDDVIAMADQIVINDGTKEQLYEKIDAILMGMK